jgi:hypothetical protein
MKFLRPSRLRPLAFPALFLALTVLLTPSSLLAQYEEESRTKMISAAFARSHQLGVRIGGWSNQGIEPPDSLAITTDSYYQTDFTAGSIYLEGFFGYRFNPYLIMEFSLGVVSRGEVIQVEEDGGQSVGTMMVYPILAKLRFYPLGGKVIKLHPYLMGGGGFFYGRHDIQFTSGYDAYFRSIYGSDSETKFSYTFGAGLEWPVASMVGLEFQAQYMDARFSGDIIGIRDYSSITFTVGIKHIFRNTDKDKR